MVNMAHNRDNRCTRLQIFFLIFKKLQTFFFLFFFHFAYNNTDSEVIRQNHNGVFVDILVDVCHDTHFHKCHDYRGCGYADLLAESCYRDWCRYGYCSCLQFFQNVFLLLNYRLWFVMFLRFCLFFKRTLLHSFFVLLALAAAVFELRKLISFLFLMVAFFRILLVRLRFHLGKCRTVAASAAAVVSACAALAARCRAVRELLGPLVAVVKAVPVVSFIILALFWLNTAALPLFISALMVFPPVYLSVLEGIGRADRKLLEMAKVFRVPWGRRAAGIYLPAVLPSFRAAVSVSLGLCWKAGAAAEVIGLPAGTIGERLYTAKVYFETGDLFAWTAVIVAVSVGFEKLFLRAVDALAGKAGC